MIAKRKEATETNRQIQNWYCRDVQTNTTYGKERNQTTYGSMYIHVRRALVLAMLVGLPLSLCWILSEARRKGWQGLACSWRSKTTSGAWNEAHFEKRPMNIMTPDMLRIHSAGLGGTLLHVVLRSKQLMNNLYLLPWLPKPKHFGIRSQSSCRTEIYEVSIKYFDAYLKPYVNARGFVNQTDERLVQFYSAALYLETFFNLQISRK